MQQPVISCINRHCDTEIKDKNVQNYHLFVIVDRMSDCFSSFVKLADSGTPLRSAAVSIAALLEVLSVKPQIHIGNHV